MSVLTLQFRDVSRVKAGLVLACLLTCALAPALHAQQPGTAVVFYAQPQVSDELWLDLLQSLRTDLAAGMGPLEQNPTYLRGDELSLEIDFSKVITVKLLGRCDVMPGTDRLPLRGPLGWVLQVSGTIQPFIFVDCERLAQVLWSSSVGLTKYERRHEMAQAIAHVVIHEWIHIATQTRSHGARGITRQFLSPAELTGEPGKNTVAIAAH